MYHLWQLARFVPRGRSLRRETGDRRFFDFAQKEGFLAFLGGATGYFGPFPEGLPAKNPVCNDFVTI